MQITIISIKTNHCVIEVFVFFFNRWLRRLGSAVLVFFDVLKIPSAMIFSRSFNASLFISTFLFCFAVSSRLLLALPRPWRRHRHREERGGAAALARGLLAGTTLLGRLLLRRRCRRLGLLLPVTVLVARALLLVAELVFPLLEALVVAVLVFRRCLLFLHRAGVSRPRRPVLLAQLHLVAVQSGDALLLLVVFGASRGLLL